MILLVNYLFWIAVAIFAPGWRFGYFVAMGIAAAGSGPLVNRLVWKLTGKVMW